MTSDKDVIQLELSEEEEAKLHGGGNTPFANLVRQGVVQVSRPRKAPTPTKLAAAIQQILRSNTHA